MARRLVLEEGHAAPDLGGPPRAHADADGTRRAFASAHRRRRSRHPHQDIAALFHYEDIHDVILVGHSYGGMVVAGAAPSLVARLAGVIYLDAFLPDDGKAQQDYVPLGAPDGAWRLPPPGKPPRFGVKDPADVAWMEARLGDHPLQTMTQPVRISADITARVPHTFILCTKIAQFAAAAARAKQRGFKYRELLSAAHDAMISQPAELAKLLAE